MPHNAHLIATFVAAIVLAFVLGALANRLRLSPLVGYLLAGVAVGPFTPGFVADQSLAPALAEIGVILLMFGVGLHFSLGDLLSVRRVAVPGALVQIGAASAFGMLLAWALGWSPAAGLLFGFSLSVASTVVMLRAFEEHRLLETERGRIAVGWLIVEDLVMVLVLVLAPALADFAKQGEHFSVATLMLTAAITLGKVAAFVVLMLLVGRRAIPWLLKRMAVSGSRELFTLAVLSIALGVAFGSAMLFGVSFALGAFFAGMVLNESEFSHKAATDSLPLRDAFAVLFFVSVGMLFDPGILLREPLLVLTTFLIIVVGKSLAAMAIVRLLGHPNLTAATVAASLAQIGEFSFILATLGVDLDILPASGRDLILAGAMLSILLNPLLFVALSRYERGRMQDSEARFSSENFRDHVVLVGFGRVGSLVGDALLKAGKPVAVIELQDDPANAARALGLPVLQGDASAVPVLEAAGIKQAAWLLVTIPNAVHAGTVMTVARTCNPAINVVASAYSLEEEAHLRQRGASQVITGGREIARVMSELSCRPASAHPQGEH